MPLSMLSSSNKFTCSHPKNLHVHIKFLMLKKDKLHLTDSKPGTRVQFLMLT